MVQPNSAQREPSMEEILASIRRIIEDSDSSRKGTESGTSATPVEAASEATNVHAFRLSLHDDRDRETEKDEAAVSFRDAGASAVSSPQEQESETPAARAQTPSWAGGAISGPANEEEDPAPADEIEMELSLDDFGAGSEETAPADSDTETAADAGLQRPAIISDSAGRQVAASFGELSAALEARSRKSLEEMAEGMLRPMLQDWLDNNLPHLVERLVREEIERIARGPAASR